MSTSDATAPETWMVAEDLAIRFCNLLQDNMDWDTVSPQDWRGRAVSAMTTAAEAGTRFSEVFAEAARKLQIDTTLVKTDGELAALTTALTDPVVFVEFANVLRTQAVYIVPMTKIRRDAAKAEKRLTR